MRVHTIAAKLASSAREASARAPDESFDPERPRAAVAAILRELDDARGAELFFIRRAEHPRDPWSGHIAFPGGRREAKDAGLVDTAIRETFEEVGIDLAQAELLARLPDLPAIGRTRKTNLVVTPFVFAVREDPRVVPNYEVSETLWIPFAKLAAGEGRGTFPYTWDGKSWELPCFRLESPATPPRETVLWGMTYRMLETLFEALLDDEGDGSLRAQAG